MSKFIEIDDYDASLRREFIDVITRENPAVLETCEDRAIAEMRGKLSAVYDCDTLFNAEGVARNQLLLMAAIDLTVYHLLTLCNPQKMTELRKERAAWVREWLKSVAKGNEIIEGAARKNVDATQTSGGRLAYSLSNRKRRSHL